MPEGPRRGRHGVVGPGTFEREPRRRRAGPFRWIWRELARIRLTVWLLIIMAVTMIVGSVFPQGYDASTYIQSWGEGRYAALAKWGFLNLFHTKYFLILGAILLLNLVFCSVIRWLRRSGAGFAGTTAPPDAKTVDLGDDIRSATSKAKEVLRSRRYKILSGVSDVITARRGPWPEGVSLLYHLAMAVAIVGFIVSALTAFEGDVTLYPGEPESVPMTSAETGLFRIRNAIADWDLGGWQPFAFARPDTTTWGDRVVTLTLDEFRTEWELYEGKYYPRDWISELTVEWPIKEGQIELMGRVVEAEGTTTQKDLIIEVNRPLRRGGLTFYQMAYEQTFDVVVRRGAREAERIAAQSYVPFTLESVGGMFFPGTLRVGTLFQKYRETEPIVPHVPLKWQPPEPEAEARAEDAPAHGAPPERVEIGDLSAEVPLEMGGVTLTLENPYEGSVLSYRHDPGVPLLYAAIVAFLVGLSIRTYWPSYRVRVWVDPTPEGIKGRVVLRATGMLGEPDAIERDLLEALAVKAEETEETSPPKTGGEGGPLDPSYFGRPEGGDAPST
jgi:cytochrome c biogenesis protein ResB